MINRVQYTTFKKLYSLLSITDKKKKEKWIFYFTRKTRLPKWPCSRPNQRRTNKISALYDSQLQTSHRAPNWHRRTCPENWIFHTRVPEKRTLPRRAEGGTKGWTVINLSCVRGPGLEDKTGEFCLNVSKTRSGSDKTEREKERGGKSSVDGFSKLDENPRARLFAPQKPLEFSKLVRKISKVKISEHRFEL